MSLRARLTQLVYAWEAVQVELQGRYSLERLRDMLHYAKHSSRVRHAVTVVLTPVPCLTFMILLDMLPIRPPTLGFAEQTIWVVVRLSIVAWVMAFMMSKQIHQSSPTLPYPLSRHIGIPTITATIIGLSFCGLSVTVGFPVPFGIQLLTPLWFVLLTSMLWHTWKHAIRADAEARGNLVSYIPVFIIQVAIVYAYPLFNVAFTSSSPEAQPYVSIGLPVMKLIFKNLMSKGVFNMEDLAPTTIVLNMDVFHAMFVSSTMQQAQSRGTTVVIMVTDVIQSLIAIFEVHQVQRRVNRLARECQLLELGSQAGSASSAASQRALRRGAIDYALHIVDTCPAVRSHPEIVFPRHHPSRVNAAHASGPTVLSVRPTRILPFPKLLSRATLAPAASKSPLVADVRRATEAPVAPATVLSETDRLQLECVKSVLKMLHMIEFYVLIELAEVLVAIMYTIYMLAIAHLPNRAYYKQLAPLSTHELEARVVQLAVYCALELFSFVLFCWIIDRKVRHFSSIQQLAFVLHKHALVVQTTIFMWVFFLVQISFEHFGSDYTFRFAWLHTKQAPNTTPAA